MDYTYATLICSSEDQQAAKDLLSQDYFNLGLSTDGSAPATHYVSSGPFSNEELNTAMNQIVTPFWVQFGMEPDYNGLTPIVIAVETV